jgi:hypothetical protein
VTDTPAPRDLVTTSEPVPRYEATPRISSNSTQPHNSNRPTKRAKRLIPTAGPPCRELDLLKILMRRPYARPRPIATSTHHVKVIAYIKRESVGFHKTTQKAQRRIPPAPGSNETTDYLGRELHQVRQLINLTGDTLKRLIQQTTRGIVSQRVVG